MKRKITIGNLESSVVPAIVVSAAIKLTYPHFWFSDKTLLLLIGLILFMCGLGIQYWALDHIKRNNDDFWLAKRSTKKRYLVSIGPYKYIRHPIYAGAMIEYFGFVLNFLNLTTIILSISGLVIIIYTAVKEEKFLSETLPGYKNYTTKTGRFFPQLVGR
jgi:protein-S-isoprenylcysteine O-methyltransferase Ste14